MKTLKLLLLLFVPLFVQAQTVQYLGTNNNIVEVRNAFNLPKDSIGSGNIRLKDTTLQYKVGSSWRTVSNSFSNAFLPKTFTASQTINTKGFSLDIANVDGGGNGYIYMSANESYPTYIYLSDSVIEFGGKPSFERLAGGRGYVIADSAGKLSKVTLDTNVVSNAATLSLTTKGYYSFNGTTTTWTLGAVATNVTTRYVIANMGSGNLTINAPMNTIWEAGTLMSSKVLTAGETAIIWSNGTYWVIQ